MLVERSSPGCVSGLNPQKKPSRANKKLSVVYYCIPETLGRSLEEVGAMIDAGIPTRQWTKYRYGDVQEEFGQDQFRDSAKRRKMTRGNSEFRERVERPSEEATVADGLEEPKKMKQQV